MRRKNARFTGTQSGLSRGVGPRELAAQFYAQINRAFPGNTPVPIPQFEAVQPKHDLNTQAFVFADYAVRKFAPIALEAVELATEASELRRLPKIVDADTANDAYYAATSARDDTVHAWEYAAVDAAAQAASILADYPYRDSTEAANLAAESAHYAALFNDDETWAAVNEMLNEL